MAAKAATHDNYPPGHDTQTVSIRYPGQQFA